MQLLVTVRNRSHAHYAHLNRVVNLQVEVSSEGTVGDVAQVLSSKTQVPSGSFKIILCGKVLAAATSLQSLLLGPQTSLAAVVVDVCDASLTPASVDSTPTDVPSFQVFCKVCNSLQRGKLRVFCSQCTSSSIVLKRDPEQWSDVIASNTISAQCEDCEEATFAKFLFKCVSCDQVAIPLVHVRGYRGQGECSICLQTLQKVVVDVGCHHETCVDCFVSYMESAFTQQRFILRPPNGYTLPCPVHECRGCVTDAHLFYLLGVERYAQYQTRATEKFVSLTAEGLFCPYSNCGAAFLWEQPALTNMVRCPECHRTMCCVCRRERCTCAESDASETTIKSTCRRCPSCAVNTEHDGGCAHMHCANCGSHWCFNCGKLWSEQCQWDHWFN